MTAFTPDMLTKTDPDNVLAAVIDFERAVYEAWAETVEELRRAAEAMMWSLVDVVPTRTDWELARDGIAFRDGRVLVHPLTLLEVRELEPAAHVMQAVDLLLERAEARFDAAIDELQKPEHPLDVAVRLFAISLCRAVRRP